VLRSGRIHRDLRQERCRIIPSSEEGPFNGVPQEIAHLRPRTNTFGAVLRIRHAMAFAIHKYFNDKGFFYLHTL